MTLAKLSESVSYRLLEESDLDPMIYLIAASFSSAEPPAVAMGLTVEEMTAFLRTLVPQALSDGLTTIAEERSTGKIIGAMLSDDLASQSIIDWSTTSKRFLPIFAMLGQLERQYLRGVEASRGEYLHLFMLAVDARFRGCGIAQRLIQNCLENAKTKGYQRAVTEATSRTSQHVFRKLGFEERIQFPYDTYTYEGQRVFSSITDQGGTSLMEKII